MWQSGLIAVYWFIVIIRQIISFIWTASTAAFNPYGLIRNLNNFFFLQHLSYLNCRKGLAWHVLWTGICTLCLHFFSIVVKQKHEALSFILSIIVVFFPDFFRENKHKGLFIRERSITGQKGRISVDRLCLLNCLRSKNTLKEGKFWECLKVIAEPKVMENLKRSWKKSWKVMEFEELKRVRTLLQQCTSASWNVHGLWFVVGGFRSNLYVFVF